MKWQISGVILSVLCACSITSEQNFDPEEPKFYTTEAAALYFKNVRSFYYDLEERDGVNVFCLSKSDQEAAYPNLILNINMDWRKDQSYLSLSNSHYFPESGPISVQSLADDGGTQQFQLLKRDRVATFIFVAKLYQSIQADQKLTVVIDGQKHPLLDDQKDREAFLITAFDYYRLVGLQ